MDTVTIAGRKFKGIEGSTMENDVFNQGMIARAGLSRLHMETGETPDQFARRVYQSMAGNTDMFLLLGGLMIPAEIDATAWSEELAQQTATFLRRCTVDKDKRIIQGQLSAAVVGFIKAELISIAFIQKYLSDDQLLSPKPNEADGPSETGPESSAQ